jgi:hypothetical protein
MTYLLDTSVAQGRRRRARAGAAGLARSGTALLNPFEA